MYLGRTLAIVGVTYLAVNMASGAWTCYNEFCPGDREADYVYTVKDEDGKIWYMEDGKAIPETEYKKAHANMFEYIERDTKNGKE